MEVTVLFCLLLARLDFRGVWVPRWSIADHEKILDNLDGRFNHIFLQVFALGETWYPSELAPNHLTSDEWLKEFLAEAHRRKIKVSAWINVFYSWGLAPPSSDPRHPINAHPDWYLLNRTGRSILDYPAEELRARGMEGYYLAPAHPGVRDYLLRIVGELIQKYDFDGIHFDYIRYPNDQFTGDSQLRTQFDRKYYFDPSDLVRAESLQLRISQWGYEDLTEKWQRFAPDNLSALVAQLYRMIKSAKPGLLVSAAVKPDYRTAKDDYLQDWQSWLNAGEIDFVCLMAYGRNLRTILKNDLAAVTDPGRVVVGLGAYAQSSGTIAEQVEEVAQSPFLGVTIFSYEDLKKDRQYLNALSLPALR
jgi:uncharacterized lipoprotein YddW (UPF0748 family)